MALAMAVATSGTGASIMQLTNTSYATMANAAFTSLATQATTALVNNRGNLNQTFIKYIKNKKSFIRK
ncbi:hypothetical protein F542_13910 [Bibersteinia trehalosi USDA-ARS-USMARC-188]|uniref:DUF637 domain-containing protein n=2 Tax=Bibersteinia trehalosi TaxID=47735 RepID=A0A4V7IAT7_BIBTR|nr:DUF637 domain-containing protein [Bibersteinia trehalosi]AGH38091.1 hypothetical protein WQG_8140 [Bibersteinia trehalosi USDA-ARS-USMARC-192]AHG82109.1 hypothetical protein F542_13910 [Bibersteinia trehalosi USDA-ARS-USMARC-188]AHG84416.1 hypothetical protein F543_15520 [Bibersteinia trehalosi USDA-ARS-USMARC-189]